MNAAVIALIDPSAYPAAAMTRLLETGGLLRTEAARADRYAPWLLKAADLAERSSSLLEVLLAGDATEGETAGVLNSERLARAGARLFAELARRLDRRLQIDAMYWAKLHRQWYHSVALTRREFAPTATLGLNTVAALPVASIRILPGAQATLAELDKDPWRVSATWDIPTMADTLTEWVL